MSTAEAVLKISIENKICLLTLNRPERRNALSKELSSALRLAILDADANPDISLVAITGTGTAFCSGADLKDARAGDDAGRRFGGPLHQQERSPFEVLIDLRKPFAGNRQWCCHGGWMRAGACLRFARGRGYRVFPAS
jgi:enoyl-CoA hydratase